MGNNEWEMFKGDNKDPKVVVTRSSDGATVDITNAQVVFTVKENATSSATIIQKKNLLAGGDATQIEMTNPTSGECKVHILPADTSSIRASKYIYDVQVVLSPYGTQTIMKDNLIIKQDVTN